jgi:hypothetical protein
MSDTAPFFIVGCGRSGTTMLRLILACHSRIHIPPETWFIIDLVREIPVTAALSPAEVERAVDIVTSHRRWPDMGIPTEEYRRWVRGLAEPRLLDLLNLIYQHQLDACGKQRFGDKTPGYIHIIPELVALYPSAKFIHLIRDGRDVAMSYFKVSSMRYYERKDFNWTQAMRRRREYAGSSFASQILEIRYEDLVSDPATTLSKICSFLGEEFEDAMLNWQSSVSDLLPDRARDSEWHPNIGKPIMTDAARQWEKRLSAVECFAMESCLQDDLRRLGYPLRFGAAGWRPLLTVFAGLLGTAAPLLKRGIPYLQRRNVLPKGLYL